MECGKIYMLCSLFTEFNTFLCAFYMIVPTVCAESVKSAETSPDLCGNIIQDAEMSFFASKLHTCTSWVNLCLSSGGLPRDPGYSKSRSRPSKLCMRRKLMANRMNLLRFSDVSNMADIRSVPKFQPPTPSSVLIAELLYFIALKRSYLKKKITFRLICC